VNDSLRDEDRLYDRGVEVRPDPFFKGVSRRLGYELIVAGFEVEARQRAAPAWKPHLDDPSRIERLARSELLRKGIVPLDDDLVQDMAQDVRLRVHEKLHLFEHRRDATFEGWLRVITREVVRHRLPRYLTSNVPIEEVDEQHRLGVEEGFEQDVVDRVVLSSLVPLLRAEPRLGSLVEKRRREEALTKAEMMRWGRNVHLLVHLCERMGVTKGSF
jgi:DNA-directed RNA polymerase specialized sigma24 family protein